MIQAAATTPTRVLIVSDDPMGGHRAAAQAVNQALQQLDGDTFTRSDVKLIDFNDLSSPERQLRHARWNPANITDKALARKMFADAMKPSMLKKFAWKHLSCQARHKDFPEAEGIVAGEKPDILLSVHMDTTAMSRAWQRHDALRAPAHCVVTDYIAHYVWAQDNIARYYVASEDVKRDLQSFGIPADRVMVTGIPVNPTIAAPDDRPKAEVKQALGLDPSLPVVMIMGGSKGDQKYEDILQALERQGSKAQVVALCGRNETKRQEVQALAKGLSFPVHAMPYVDMRDYYHAADIVVTKPGGLTTAEVLAKGKAMIAVSPYPGMEEAQVERLTAAGVARYGETPEMAAKLAVHLLEDAPAREKLENAAKALGRPDAAMTIARDLLASAVRPA
jgi:processive 1,2-diacylglycerol beta-glucosyltransferase